MRKSFRFFKTGRLLSLREIKGLSILEVALSSALTMVAFLAVIQGIKMVQKQSTSSSSRVEWTTLLSLIKFTYSSEPHCTAVFGGMTYAGTAPVPMPSPSRLAVKNTDTTFSTFLEVRKTISGYCTTSIQVVPMPGSTPISFVSAPTKKKHYAYLSIKAKLMSTSPGSASAPATPCTTSLTPDLISSISTPTGTTSAVADPNLIPLVILTDNNVIQSCVSVGEPPSSTCESMDGNTTYTGTCYVNSLNLNSNNFRPLGANINFGKTYAPSALPITQSLDIATVALGSNTPILKMERIPLAGGISHSLKSTLYGAVSVGTSLSIGGKSIAGFLCSALGKVYVDGGSPPCVLARPPLVMIGPSSSEAAAPTPIHTSTGNEVLEFQIQASGAGGSTYSRLNNHYYDCVYTGLGGFGGGAGAYLHATLRVSSGEVVTVTIGSPSNGLSGSSCPLQGGSVTVLVSQGTTVVRSITVPGGGGYWSETEAPGAPRAPGAFSVPYWQDGVVRGKINATDSRSSSGPGIPGKASTGPFAGQYGGGGNGANTFDQAPGSGQRGIVIVRFGINPR